MKIVESLIVSLIIALCGVSAVTSVYNNVAIKRLETHLEGVENLVNEVSNDYGFGFSDLYVR